MSVKVILLAMAAAMSAAAESFTASASDADPAPAKGGGKAPAPKAAVPAKGANKPKGKAKAAEVDFDSLKEKAKELIQAHSKEHFAAALGVYEIAKLNELDESKYEEFAAYLDQCISGEVDPTAAAETDGDESLFD